MSVKASISLTDSQEAFARTLVAEGRYASLSAVLQQGLELLRHQTEAAGSMAALRRQQADAAELDRLRKENKRLKLENEILEKPFAFFASRAAKT